MAESFERDLSYHAAKLDGLMAALGFNGDRPELDIIDYMVAAHEALPTASDSEDYQRRRSASLVEEFRQLEATGITEGAMASYLLGSAVWRVAAASPNKSSRLEHQSLIDRSLQNIRISRESFGYGDERKFHHGIVNYTLQFPEKYDADQRRYLRKLCRYTEQEIMTSQRLSRQGRVTEKSASSPWLPYVISGLASIAMVPGYRIQPPEDQRDENGAWQLPEEGSDQAENDDL